MAAAEAVTAGATVGGDTTGDGTLLVTGNAGKEAASASATAPAAPVAPASAALAASAACWLACGSGQCCARTGALLANLLPLPSDATDGLTRVASLAIMPQLCAFLAGNDKPAASLSKQNES